MPAYRDRDARRLYMREYRARKKTEREAAKATTSVRPFTLPDDPVGALSAWAKKTLIVPPGHPLAGAADGAAGLRRGLPEGSRWGAHESALCIDGVGKTRRALSAAVLALGHLVGPLRTDGWRGAVASVITKEKASGVEEPGGRLSPRRRSWTCVIRSSAVPRKDHLAHRHPRNPGQREDGRAFLELVRSGGRGRDRPDA